MSRSDGDFAVELHEPSAIAADPGGEGVEVTDKVALAADGFGGEAVGENGDVRRDHAELMVADLGAGEGAGVEVLHDLIASLDGPFDVEEVREKQGMERGEIVRLKCLPQIDLLDEDEVGLGVEGGGLLGCWNQGWS